MGLLFAVYDGIPVSAAIVILGLTEDRVNRSKIVFR